MLCFGELLFHLTVSVSVKAVETVVKMLMFEQQSFLCDFSNIIHEIVKFTLS